MSRNGFKNAERAQCMIRMTEGYGATAVQRLFRDDYSRAPPDRSTIRLWRADYQQRGTHTHRGGNGRPQISAQTKNRIRKLFDDNPRTSLRATAAASSVEHAMIWNFLRKELGRFPYKLQMGTSLMEDHKMRRKSFAHYCRRELINDAGYLESIVFSPYECKISLPGSVNKQNCRIWWSKRPNELYEMLENSPSVMVWFTLSKRR